MRDDAIIRSINYSQLATVTDRLLAFGPPKKYRVRSAAEAAMVEACTARVRPLESPARLREREDHRRSRARTFAIVFGLVVFVTLGIETTHLAFARSTAHAAPSAHEPTLRGSAFATGE